LILLPVLVMLMASFSDAFVSCTQCHEALGSNCWCWQTGTDYLQVFIIVLFIMLMYLAAFLMYYARASIGFGGISEIKFFDLDVSQIESLRSDVRAVSMKYGEHGSISGIPIKLFLALNTLLAAIYFTIKLLMFLQPSSHYLATINQDFDEQPWSEFYNARIMLLTTMYCHSIILSFENAVLWQENKEYLQSKKCMRIALSMCSMVFFVDFMGSIALLCIHYPLLIAMLYMLCMSVLAIVAVLLCHCCVVPFFATYTRLVSFICTMLVCRKPIEEPCGRFMRSIANGFVFFSLYYLLICAVASLAFAFVGGPNDVAIFMDVSPYSMDLLIVVLYTAATAIGIFGFFVGACLTINKQCNESAVPQVRPHARQTTTGYHHPRNTNDSTDLHAGFTTAVHV